VTEPANAEGETGRKVLGQIPQTIPLSELANVAAH